MELREAKRQELQRLDQQISFHLDHVDRAWKDYVDKARLLERLKTERHEFIINGAQVVNG